MNTTERSRTCDCINANKGQHSAPCILSRLTRMHCGKGHPALFAIPEEAHVDWCGLAPWVLTTDGEHLRCKAEGCNRAMRAVTVRGRPGKQECGERCVNATGPACECKCCGENHGGAAF